MSIFILRYFGIDGGDAGEQETGEADSGDLFVPDAGEPVTETETAEEQQPSPEDRRKAYDSFIKENHDLYEEDFQKAFDRRFKGHKQMESAYKSSKPLIDKLMKVHGVSDVEALAKSIDDDAEFWERKADEAGMTTSAYKRFIAMDVENSAAREASAQREAQDRANADIENWENEAAEMRSRYPDFDLRKEVGNEDFVACLKAGFSVEKAYRFAHEEELMKAEIAKTKQETEKKVTDNIRATGARPREAGLRTSGALRVNRDPGKLTDEELEAIAEAVKRGETITF